MEIQSLEISENDNKPKDSPKKRSFRAFITSIDQFTFIPFPTSTPIYTPRSLCASLMMLSIFLIYLVYNLMEFITNNAPRVNEYTNQIPLQNITLPNIAFAFFLGDPFTSIINDETILKFQFDQVYKHENLSIPDKIIPIHLQACKPDWLPNQQYSLLCPMNDTNMLGALYTTKSYAYPRIIINLCDTKGNRTCKSSHEITQTCAGYSNQINSSGRVILFLQDNGPNLDLTTGQKLLGQSYRVFQFFLIPQLYPRFSSIDIQRALVIFRKSSYTVYPDYLRRWSAQINYFLNYKNLYVVQSDVSIYNKARAYQIQFQVQQEELVVSLIYYTILDEISKWGAFWGVLFGLFGMYLLVYNSQYFYKRNETWERFERKLSVNLQPNQDIEKKNDTYLYQY